MKISSLCGVVGMAVVTSLAFGCGIKGESHSSLSAALIPLVDRGFQESGSIMVSSAVPAKDDAVHLACEFPAEERDAKLFADQLPKPAYEQQVFAPLFAFIPPSPNFIPAANETWLEVDRAQKLLRVHTGDAVEMEVQAEGTVALTPGSYSIQHKQHAPLWYAPDSYFTKRKLAVPPAGDRLRYLRGALGELALFPAPEFPIHSGPIWSDEVGGLKVGQDKLADVFSRLRVGSTVLVR